MLQPDKLKKLNENAMKMAASGSSKEDIIAMKDAFIKQFGNEEPLKKKDIGEQNAQIPQQNATVLPSEDGLSDSKLPIEDEEDYFTGAFGNVLRGFDTVVPLGIGDFIDDMARSVSSGYRQGDVAQTANDLLLKGHKSTPEQLQKFIDANKSAQQLKPSDEMNDYNKIYEEEGKGFWGVIKGLVNNPTVIPEVLTSSLISMATNTDALKAGGAAVGVGATRGAIAGAISTPEFAGAGAIPGAVAGAASAVPYAFGLASTVVEAGATFGELLTEELKGKELTKENVKSILENPEKLQSIRNKAIARGIIIGTLDALTGKLASGVGAKILSRSASKSATGAATKAAVVKSTAAGSAIESLGGSVGEASARAAIGQEMDVSEIALEGIAELPGGVRSTIQARLAKPSYQVNGEKVSVEQIDELINTMTPEELTNTDIVIKNDYEGRMFKIQDKVVTNSIKKQVKEANPELNEPSLNAITELEKQLNSLEGNKTQTGKDKAALLRNKIKDIQENQLVEAVSDEVEAVSDEVEGSFEAPDEKIAKLEAELETITDDNDPRIDEIDAEISKLETIKTKKDAIQEQSTTEIPVQSEAGVSKTMEEGKPKSEPEVITEEGVKEEVTPSETIITKQAGPPPTSEGLDIVTEPTPIQFQESRVESAQSLLDEAKTKKAKNKAMVDLVKEQGKLAEMKAFDKIKSEPETIEATQVDKQISNLEGEVDSYAIDIENYENDIKTETQNTKEGLAELKQKAKGEIENVKKDKSLNKDEKLDKIEEIKYQIENFKEEQASIIDNYKEDLKEAKAEQKKVQKKLEKIKQGTINEETVVEDTKGKIDELLELDTNDKSTLAKISSELGDMIEDIKRIEKEMGSNILLVPMKYILQTIKGFVDAGMTLQEAIKRVASDNKVTQRDIVKGLNSVSEITKIAPAYNELMAKVDKLITRQKSKGVTEKKIISNLDTMVRKSDVYLDENTNDAQRKIMEREARARMGVAPRKAPSIGRVLGVLNDIKNVSREEKLQIISRIRELSRDAAKDLVQEIRDLAKGGKITATQATNIISKFSKVNMLNEISVSNFVDYMAKVFADAEYGNKLDVAKSKLKNAKKNIVTKLGIADGLVLPLQQLFNINPNLIPIKSLDRYLELLDMFSKRQSVLNLQEKLLVTNDVQDILSEIDAEKSKANELAYRFENSDNKVFDDEGKLNYSESIKKMLKEGEIDSDESDLMKKYKKDIIPQVEKEQKTEQEIQEEKDDLIKEIKNSKIDSDKLSLKDERNSARNIAELIKGKAIEALSNTELKNLLKVIDNINNGYLPHYAQLIKEKLNANEKSSMFKSAINKAKALKFSMIYSKIKSKITKKDAVLELIRRNPLFYIDQVFNDFKTKDIFNSILKASAEGEAKFSSDIKNIQSTLDKALNKVSNSFMRNGNKVIMSKYKMMTYMLQLEYESNEGNAQVNPASEYLDATIKKVATLKSKFNERDAKMLQDILDKYSVDGNIDNKKLYDSFNSAEKSAIKTIREINESLTEKALYTSAVIRGQRINPLTNYIHLNVINDNGRVDEETSLMNSFNDSRKPSTKAKSLIERTKGAKAIDFDIFSSVNRGAKGVLIDYHLTEPIRTARKTINNAVSELEAQGPIPKDKRQIINAVEEAFEESVSNLLQNSYISTSLGNEIADYISKQGYRTVLAGTGRFVSELVSNVGFVIFSDPTTFAEGLKHMKLMMSANGASVMNNVNSTETNRIFPSEQLSGRLIDSAILSQTSGEIGKTASNSIFNKARQIWNLTGKRFIKNPIELTSDVLISTPDKAIMRPVWFGAFASQFKKETGNDVDFEKIAENDEVYMNENKDAIEKSKVTADERSVITGASKNAFTGMLKGTNKTTSTVSERAFNNFNSFMSTFLIYEFITARTGLMAAMGNGSLSKKQGVALLAGVTTRMTVYSLMTKALGEGLIGLLFGSEDDEDDEKTLNQNIGQALASTFTSLLLGRDFGNAAKTVINIGVEKFNENYLDDLRNEEYDPYKDAIQFSAIPPEKTGQERGVEDFLIGFSGSYQPLIKTVDLIAKKGFSEEKKTDDAQERLEKEQNIRIPLEVLGNLGFVPLYKEVRKVVLNDIYESLRDDGGQSKEELKKTNPRLYKKLYRESSSDKIIKEREKRIKERENRD